MNTLIRLLLLIACLLGGMNARAAVIGQMNEDIDIFLLNASIPGERPNVLIVWDTTANWNQTVNFQVTDADGNVTSVASTAFDLEKQALVTAISKLDDKYNVGLMMFTESGNPNSNARGAYVRFAIQQMTVANKQRLVDIITALHPINDRGSNAQYAKAMHEAYLYFAGRPALAGAGQMKRDCLAFGAGVGGGPGAKDFDLVCAPHSTTYVSPIVDGCQKNYIFLISNGTTDSGENNEAQKLLANLNGVAPKDPIVLSPSGEQANWADEYSRFLRHGNPFTSSTPSRPDAHVKTYTIAVYDKSREKQLPTAGQIALSRSQANPNQGDGRFFDGTDLTGIETALDQFFQEIKAVDGVFASTTLPVSVNVRGTHVNQLYMGVFRPDANLAPRWPGNLKMYQLALDPATDTVFLADADGNPAENPTTGFINNTARSFWTQTSSFWAFQDPDGDNNPSHSDNPDGPLVERGSVAQSLRGGYTADATSGRNLYTCTGTCAGGDPLSGSPFDLANGDITQASLGAADATERDNIIKWMRGEDNIDDENVDASNTDVRASIHGDVLHSRPAVINYNRNSPSDDNDVYAFYGSNDAVIRAVRGGLEVGSNPNAGKEAWGFIPPEFFGKLKRLRSNTPAMSPTTRRDYFADGPIGVYQKDNNKDGKLDITIDANDKVHIFMGMRRGGRLIYALDVSDPLAPRLLWKKDNTSTGYGEMGQTWSEPKVATIGTQLDANNVKIPRTVLIMGLGYDTNQDKETIDPAVDIDTMGRGVIVIDATNGDVIWQATGTGATNVTNNVTIADMTHSISSDVTILDRNRDGFIDRVYVGDNGGNLWRIDIDNIDPTQWAVNKLASIAGTAHADRRKFQFPPDVVFNPGASPSFDSVLIGTGDREHPFDTVVANRYYMFKDPDTGLLSSGGAAIAEADLYDVSANLIQVGTDAEKAAAQASLDSGMGWMLPLLTGEKVISSSVTLAGTTFFNTNQPTSVATNSCTNNLGVARQYALSFEDASATIDYGTPGLTTSDRSSTYGEGGFLPSPVPAVVKLGDDGRLYQVVVAGTKISIPPQAKLESRYRTYWYMQTD